MVLSREERRLPFVGLGIGTVDTHKVEPRIQVSYQHVGMFKDRLQEPCCFCQHLLCLYPVGDVLDTGDHPGIVSVVVKDGRGPQRRIHAVPVLAQKLEIVLLLDPSPSALQVVVAQLHTPFIGEVEQSLAPHLLDAVAQHLRQAGIGKSSAGIMIDYPDALL